MNAPTTTTAPTTATRSPSGPPRTALRARDVADLAVASGYPCISVLVPTEPAPRMTPADQDRLRSLVGDVDHQLHEQGVTSRPHLLRKLLGQVRRAAAQPTDRALAIYVSLAVSRTFRLPERVEPRAVVEPTFATRPLVSALQRMPPHVVLVLHPTCAHLYAAADGGLRPVRQHDPFRGARRIGLPRAGDPNPAVVRDEQARAYLREVDRMLGDYRAEHPSPLVLGGEPRLVDLFCEVSRNLERLAGRILPPDGASVLDLALAGAEAVESYLRTRSEDALHQLDRALRDRPHDVASGIERCWHSLHRRVPGMLLVEEGFVCPGTPWRPASAGSAGSRGSSETGEVHDLVDDLMEEVVLRGGQLALVRDGALTGHQRIALIGRR
ncbi:baeRF3 domain-containing protein [Nocardioides sp. MAHUQ-72]|uniref:baeRF3 domain-containing protein n=1 Tax=unclassified Nocardioides TaxID=2615069 RepID=UPI003618E36E